MADSRFFERFGPFSLAFLADAAGAELHDPATAELMVEDVAALSAAGPGTVSFLDNLNYRSQFETTQATACIVHPKMIAHAPRGCALLTTPSPYRTYAVVAALFYPEPVAEGGVHPSAQIDSSARLGEGVRIEAGAVVEAKVEVGARTVIGANAVIARGVVLGADCRIGAGVFLTHALIGSKVRVYPGCRIGQDGFGFALGGEGPLAVPQLGRVVIGNDVEIGANTTIDRGSGPDTIIGDGCRIDNLVQIAHNVELGAGCVVAAQVGIAGSAKVGKGVVLGGQVGIVGHLALGDGVQVGAQSGVMRDVAAGEKVFGSPARPIRSFWRELTTLKDLAGRRKG